MLVIDKSLTTARLHGRICAEYRELGPDARRCYDPWQARRKHVLHTLRLQQRHAIAEPAPRPEARESPYPRCATSTLSEDLQGQYTKLPPRVTFCVQIIGAVIGGLLNYVIMRTVLTSQRELLLDVQGSNVWSGQQVQSYNSDAIAWGALGKPLYAPGTRYGFVPVCSRACFCARKL
jgi:hypothetical protein